MVDPLSPDEADDEPARKNDFFGKIVNTAIDADDPEFQSDYETDATTVDLLYEIDVMGVVGNDGEVEDRDWGNQTTRWITFNTNIYSKWMTVVWHLNELFDLPGDLVNEGVCTEEEYKNANERDRIAFLLEFLDGQVLKFRELTWEESEPEMDYDIDGETKVVTPASLNDQSSNDMNEMIVPIGVPSQDRLADLGAHEEADEGEVEEVDIA